MAACSQYAMLRVSCEIVFVKEIINSTVHYIGGGWCRVHCTPTTVVLCCHLTLLSLLFPHTSYFMDQNRWLQKKKKKQIM